MIIHKLIRIAILALILPAISQQMINEEASTSTQALARCEECELENYAMRLARLMTAEDRVGGDLANAMNNGREELAAYHDEVFSYITLARYGATRLTDLQRRENRLIYFFLQFRQNVLEILMNACSEHHRYQSWLEYNGRAIIIRENLTVLPDLRCLCDNHAERVALDTPIGLPLDFELPTRSFQIHRSMHHVSIYETAQYHIIPVPLIMQFFQEWLTGDDGDYLNNTVFNDCVTTLYRRFKRSLQKLVIAQIVNNEDELSRFSYTTDLSNDDIIYMEVLAYSRRWLGGNIFLGPINRGPFDPRYGMNRVGIMEAFEHDAEVIIGSARYGELLHLFNTMQNFISAMPSQNPLWRLVIGFNVYVVFWHVISNGHLTPMIDEHWEERVPTDDDLVNVQDEQERAELRSQSFWAIKKPPNRAARGAGDYKKVTSDFSSIFGLPSYDLRSLWSKFTLELMAMSLQAKEFPEPPGWLCNFTRLHDEYLLREKKPPSKNLECPNCIGFDDYLYEKVSRHRDWQKCNNGSKVSHRWCSAWKNITENLNRDSSRYEVDGKMNLNLFDVPKSILYMKNVKVMVHWLSSNKSVEDPGTREKLPVLKNFMYAPYNGINSHKSLVDLTMCYLSTFALSILYKYNECGKTFG